jgi:hypothetical protein
MEPASYNDNVLNAYLRGELPDDKIAALEDQLLRDEELFQRLETVEMNLIDRYLENEMTDPEKQHFEAVFLGNPDNKRKLNEARVFRESLALLRKKEPPNNVTPFPVVLKRVFASVRVQQVAAAAVVLIVLALIVLLAIVRWRESQMPDRNFSSMSTKVGPEQASPSPIKRSTGERIQEQWLYLKEARSGEELHVTISPDTEVLRFHYELPTNAPKYALRVTIKDQREYPIFPTPGTISAKPIVVRDRGISRRAISIDVPVSSLKLGERYRLEIVEPYASKAFRIASKG